MHDGAWIGLRERRLALRRPLRDVAAEVGIDTAHLSRIERGLVRPSPAVLGRLAIALGLVRAAAIAEMRQQADQAFDELTVALAVFSPSSQQPGDGVTPPTARGDGDEPHPVSVPVVVRPGATGSASLVRPAAHAVADG